MKKTQLKIVKTAIKLFNKNGVANVRVQDIALASGISPGNLTYHYKTKKDLMVAVLKYMKSLQKEMFPYQSVIEALNWIEVVQTYLRFQIQFRFFYRDILEISNLIPESKKQYQKQIESVINFNKNGIYLSVGKGFMIPEPHEGHYQVLATNSWAILNAWLTVREVLGEEVANVKRGMNGLLELNYPYFTDKGKEFYHRIKQSRQRSEIKCYQANTAYTCLLQNNRFLLPFLCRIIPLYQQYSRPLGKCFLKELCKRKIRYIPQLLALLLIKFLN